MSARIGWSLGAAAVVLVVWVVILAATWIWFKLHAERVRSAERFAGVLSIELPRESAVRLEQRLRRRALAVITFTWQCFALWTLWYLYNRPPVSLAEYKQPAVPPSVQVMPVWAFGGLIFAAAHIYDLMRGDRDAGNRVARIVEPRLSDAVPPVLTRLTRAAGLLPAVAAGVWLLAPVSVQHGERPAHPHPLVFVGAALLGPACVFATEAAQRRILIGRQNARTAQELAFDDALRIQTMLAILVVPWVVAASLAALVVAPLARVGSWPGAAPVLFAMSFGFVPLIVLPGGLRAKWASRYYLKRFIALSDPPSRPAAVQGAAC